jgi:putative transposase
MRNVRRFYVPDAIIFATLVAKDRNILFDLNHAHHVEMFFDRLRRVRETKRFKLLAYNFLPDHIHLLFRPTGEATFSSILQSTQRSYTFEYKNHYAIEHSLRLWQPRFWDHIIRDKGGSVSFPQEI